MPDNTPGRFHVRVVLRQTRPLALCVCILFAGIALLALPKLAQAQAAGKRVALLIGNADYAHERKLKNPANDAELLGGVLKNDLRFDDVRIERNLGVAAMDNAIRAFAERARGADAVVFYFSGHGMKKNVNDRRNFLLPIDARTGTADALDLERQAVAAEAVRDRLKTLGARVTLVVLDACRDGPGGGKSGNKGLSRNGGGNQLLVAYATEEDQTAEDGLGNNSTYAAALAEALKRPEPLLAQLDWVADEVQRRVPGQVPTRDGNLRHNAFLIPPAPSMPVGSAVAPSAILSRVPAVTVEPCIQARYVVKPGDTMPRIALEHRVNWRDITSLNGIANPNLIEVGQVLSIPCGLAATAPSSAASPTSATQSAATTWIHPTQAPLASAWDERTKGIVYKGRQGTPILAVADGEVVYSGNGMRGYGNLVIVKHSADWLSVYAHNSDLLVREGVNVKQGQTIARMGSTDADTVQLHFEMRLQGKPVNPLPLLPP